MEKEANWKYIVYCTVNIVNNKIYVGVHKTKDANKFDGYIGNGVYNSQPYTYKYSKTKFQCAVNKYGVNNFKRQTLAVFDDEEAAYTLEADIVNEEFLKRSDVYNMVLGGMGGVLESAKIKVYQYDLDGNFISEYNSFAEAASTINRDYTLISYAVRKKQKGAGYYWSTDKVEHLDLSLYGKGDNPRIIVHLYKVTGEYVLSFKSQTECAKYINTSTSEVRESALLGRCLRKQWYCSYELANTYDKANTLYLKNRPVFRYNSDGSFNKAYEHQVDAELENPGSNINKSVKGKSLDSNNYYWGLNKLDNYNAPFPKNSKRKVGKFDLNGVLVKEYDSATAAAKENGNSVWKVLSGTNKTHKNHKYSYI